MKRSPTKSIPIDRAFEIFYVDSTSPSGLRNLHKGPRGPKDSPSGWRWANKRNGYVTHSVHIDGKTYPAHRVIYAMMSGNPNPVEVDHKDRDSTNNHPFNLREATRSMQSLNKSHPNATGTYRGVERRGSKWRYEIRRRSEGIRINVGGFATEHEAYLAREEQLATLDKYFEERVL